jgi:ABC-type transport system involved in cytochrome bd biosynthesis fused ATPase/permease subunit
MNDAQEVVRRQQMFEAAEEKQSNFYRTMALVVVVIAVIAIGGLVYTTLKSGGKPTAPVIAAAATAAPTGKADALHDLKILSARMEKDRAGTTAVWLVDVNNKSKTYTYSSIQYETTYVGPDNAALLVNKGTIALRLAPGDEQNTQIRDVLYPAGTSWYKFRITGATASMQ